MYRDLLDLPVSDLCMLHSTVLPTNTLTLSVWIESMLCVGLSLSLQQPGYTVDEDSPGNVTGDRHTLYCVPIPAQTKWTRSVSSACKLSPIQNNDLSRRFSLACCVQAYGQCSMASCVREENEHQEDRAGVKRQLEEEGEGEGEMEVEEGERGGGPGTKRPREEGAPGGVATRGRSRQPDLNFPLPDETGLPCLLKVSGFSLQEPLNSGHISF